MSQPFGNKRPKPYVRHCVLDYIPKPGELFRVFVSGRGHETNLVGIDFTSRELNCSPQVAIDPPGCQQNSRDYVWSSDYRFIASQFNFVKVKL